MKLRIIKVFRFGIALSFIWQVQQKRWYGWSTIRNGEISNRLEKEFNSHEAAEAFITNSFSNMNRTYNMVQSGNEYKITFSGDGSTGPR